MLSHPRIGQRVRLHYREATRSIHPHGLTGVVLITKAEGRGPRNHLVRLDDGREVIVPAGNLNRTEDDWRQNPCGCRGCAVCGFFGHAPRPEPKVVPEQPKTEPTPFRRPKQKKPSTPGLFEETQ